MSFRSILQDVRDGIGSLSRRSFDVKLGHSFRSRSGRGTAAVHDDEEQDELGSGKGKGKGKGKKQSQQQQQLEQSSSSSSSLLSSPSCWSRMPPELLRDVIVRIESSEAAWPARGRNLVACSGVCRAWRFVTKEVVQGPEMSGKLTFPVSLKQPGPRDALLQCFIKRDRATSTYCLFLGLTPTLAEEGKFLLAARKVRKATSTDYIISLDPDDFSRGSNKYIGKLRSNFLGTKFTIYDCQPPHTGAVASTSRAGRRVGSKQVSPKVPAGSYVVAHITYELNVLGTRGPRRMQCLMESIPASALDVGGTALTRPESLPSEQELTSVPSIASKSDLDDRGSSSRQICSNNLKGPLLLKNKAPRWHEQLQCWCLNFKGRVTVPSVKNFQLVSVLEVPQLSSQNDYDRVLLQFGKVGKDLFTMDYRYPLSAFQAFAICLSSFDTKLACE